MNLAPIVLFIYNRPLHTQMTLDALSKNDLVKDSVLYIYADGAKHNATDEEKEKIAKTRELVNTVNWCKEVIIVQSEVNNGLANSIIKGVTEVVNKHGKVIVLEDDLLTAVGFLKYMNDALLIYENNPQVMHISGYMYPAHIQYGTNQTFFMNILSCWGWGTWARAWKHYNHNINDHLNKLKAPGAIKKFNIEGHADYYMQLLLNKEGKLHTWAVRWYASWLFANGFSLFPVKSLVKNNGFDDYATHTKSNPLFDSPLATHISVEEMEIKECISYRNETDKFYKRFLPYYRIKFMILLRKYGIHSLIKKHIRK